MFLLNNKSDFFQLQDYIFNPPISTIIAIILLSSILCFGYLISKKSHLTWSISYQLVVVIISIITSLILFDLNNFAWLLLVCFFILVLFNVYMVTANFVRLKNKFIIYKNNYFESKFFDKSILFLIGTILLFLFLSSLGPPTDADSLDYHLGVPLAWIRHGGFVPSLDWLHYRLVGIGESINLFGLIFGTDIFGQLIQYSGLLIIWHSLSKFANGPNQRILLALLIFSVPLNVWLASTQKPLLFPSAIMISGFCIYIQQKTSFNLFYYTVATLFIIYSIACKYSFIIPGSIMILFGLWNAYRNKIFFSAILVIIALSTITILPLYIRNIIYYGDPLSPFFEQLKSNPDLYVVKFADMLKDFGGGVSVKNILFLPFKLGITLKPTDISTVLGVGVFGFILLDKISNPHGKIMLKVSILITFGILFVGQISPRYFMEAYWLLVGAIITLPWSTRIKWFRNVLLLQACLMAGLSIYGASVLFPGALTVEKRHDVMSKVANGYNETKWINENLPSDAVVIAEIRSNALMPRKFVSWDKFWIGKGQGETKRLQTMIIKKNVTALLLRLPLNPSLDWLIDCANTSDRKIKSFTRRTRNPLNVGEPYDMQLFMINSSNPDCVLSQQK